MTSLPGREHHKRCGEARERMNGDDTATRWGLWGAFTTQACVDDGGKIHWRKDFAAISIAFEMLFEPHAIVEHGEETENCNMNLHDMNSRLGIKKHFETLS